MRNSLFLALIVSPAIALGFAGAQATSTPRPSQASAGIAFFEAKIRPILVSQCYECHSTASKPVMGGLRLDTKLGVSAGGSHGATLIPGDPDKSLLIKAVRFTDNNLKMPPKGKLTAAQIADLETWVRMGAPDPRDAAGPKKLHGLSVEEGRKHWSFQPLHVNAPGPPRTTNEKTWRRNSIDDFILNKLRPAHLTPSAPAERRTLIRRAYFDLTGLPPKPDEVEAFVSDRSPDAWEKVIDRLLASPHYGERWGRHWLDLARFAESHGYEQDYDRPNAYYYRDFVIKALNEDMPYTTFVKWQLAGDELEPENPMALMATGFLAAGTHATQITKNQVEKERYDELDDMLSTTFTSMLGMTVGCARCHDHKYDPIPTRDYYRLLSTFTKTVRSDYDVNMDPEGYRAKMAAFDGEHAPLVSALQDYERSKLPASLQNWLRDRKSGQPVGWYVADVQKAVSQGGATLTAMPDGSYLATGKNPDSDTFTFTIRTDLQNISALRIEALADPSMVKGGPGRAANGNFDLTNVTVAAASATDPKLTASVKCMTARADFEQKGQAITGAIDNDPKSGWAIDPQFGKDHTAAFTFAQPVGFSGGTVLTVILTFAGNTGHNFGRTRLALSQVPETLPLNALSRPERVERIIDKLQSGGIQASPDDLPVLLAWFKPQDPIWADLNHTVEEHQARAPKPPIEKVLISSEGVTAIRTHTQGGDYLDQTHILKRGDPNQKQEVATQSFLQVLMRTPDGERHWETAPPKGWRTSYQRLSLAKWMTDMDNGAGPLLARVIVNRLWQHHMGRGIVSTPSDFGVVGERPTHPELLDYLAAELIRNGWRLKPIHKLIMTSATYMQRSVADPQKTRIDPDNRLCWRHQRQRLEAEVIRDAELAVSGLLDTTMFGPGTLDENMKRRSIYFFVKRSKLIASLIIFDAPNALLGLPQRATTTVAPQALHLMNNKGVRECAAAMAKKVSPNAAAPTKEMIVAAYTLALGRPPTSLETEDALRFITEQSASYVAAGGSDNASKALTDFCQVMLSLNEFVYVE